jgi:hypothetical protein
MSTKFSARGSEIGAIRFLALALTAGCVLASAQVQITTTAAKVQSSALSTSGAAAESSADAMGGPLLGYMFESDTQSLRPILGIAGASHLGDAMALGLSLKTAAESPSQDYLLGIDNNTGQAQLVDLRAEPANSSSLPGANAGADRVVLSPRGSAAALYFRQTRQVQIVTGLPANPQVSNSISLASLPGFVTALAIEDGGQWLLAGVSHDGAGSVYAVSAGGSTSMVASGGQISSLSFGAASDDALVTDYARNEVVLLRDISSGPQALVLASGKDGLSGPVAAAFAADGSRVYVANSGSNQIALLPLQGGVPAFLACDCRPTQLAALRGGSAFRITGSPGEPVYLLDTAAANPRVVFVASASGVQPLTGEAATPRSTRGRTGR